LWLFIAFCRGAK